MRREDDFEMSDLPHGQLGRAYLPAFVLIVAVVLIAIAVAV